MARKARKDSKLKTLPDAVQAELYRRYQKEGGDVLAWLKEAHGVASSTGALSVFASWYPFSRPLELVEHHASQYGAALKANPKLQLNAEQISIASQIAFEQTALQLGDIKAFVNLRRLRNSEKSLELEKQKFQESTKSAIEKGLDALHAECANNPEALALFEKFRAAVMKSVEGKSK